MDGKKNWLTFRDAHYKTGKIVLFAEKEKKMLNQLDLDDLKKIEPKINKDIYDILLPEKSISNKKSYGGTSLKKVGMALKELKKEYRNENLTKFNLYSFVFIELWVWKKVNT